MRGERGQATVEWVGLLLLAMLVLAAVLVTVGWRLVQGGLRQAILQNMICAVRLVEDCRTEPELRGDYGHELAALVRANAPALLYEEGMTAMPVDFRRCRIDQCAAGAGEGTNVLRAERGERAVAFTHVIDCREGGDPAGADCSGERAGRTYLQYWFYYPGSATGEGSTPLKGVIRKASSAVGKPSWHQDDWAGRLAQGIAREARRRPQRREQHDPLLGGVPLRLAREEAEDGRRSHDQPEQPPQARLREAPVIEASHIEQARIRLAEHETFTGYPPYSPEWWEAMAELCGIENPALQEYALSGMPGGSSDRVHGFIMGILARQYAEAEGVAV